MIEFQLLIVAICAGCKLIGELWWHNAQRFIMPVVLGIAIAIVSHTWWLGLTVLPSIGIICLGYKDFGLGDAGDRGMWLFLIAVLIGLGPLLAYHTVDHVHIHFLKWYFYVPYCLVAGIWGATTRNLNNLIIAPISGAWLGVIIFLIKP